MPIIHNGVNLTDLICNGVALDKVIFNGVTVFEKAPAIIREPATGGYCDGEFGYGFYSAYDDSIQRFVLEVYWNNTCIYASTDFTLKSLPLSFIYNGWTYYRGNLHSYTHDDFLFQNFYIYRIKN